MIPTPDFPSQPGDVPAHILVICADPDAGCAYSDALAAAGHTARLADLGPSILADAAVYPADLVVVAAGPDPAAALEGCRELIGASGGVLLLVTPHADEEHLLAGYAAGADEVVAGPLSPELLCAKVSAWLGKARSLPSLLIEGLRAGGFTLYLTRRRLALPNGEVCRLSGLEARLLYVLMRRPGVPVEAPRLVRWVWGYDYEQGDHGALKNLVYRLRKKIEADPSQPRVLVTVDTGYCFIAGEGLTGED